MRNEIRDIIPQILIRLFSIFPIDDKKIVLESFRGINCEDNPRAIYEAMRTKRPDLHYYWVTKDGKQIVPHTKTIKHGSLGEIYHLATAKLWIDNKRKGCWTRKRRGQYYLQTWHGGLSEKKVEKDAQDTLDSYYIKSAIHDSELADFFTAGSRWQKSLYRRSFWFKHTILEYGLPRADIFYKDATDIKNKVRQHYELPAGAKICLYAPTFRDSTDLAPYSIDYDRLLEALAERFPGEWYIIIRLHPNIQYKQNQVTYDEKRLNGSSYPDVNELIVASDAVISDYSGCMFEALEAKKYVFAFATDYADYMKERGYYFKPEEVPFPFASNNDELVMNLRQFDKDKYEQEANTFLTETVGSFNDGHASEKTANYLLNIMGLQV